MVDFNNESIVGQSPTEVLKLLILEKQDYVIESLKILYEYYYRTASINNSVFKSSLQCLYYYLYSMFENSISLGDKVFDVVFTTEVHQELKKNINSESFEDNLKALEFMQKYLYSKNLTKLDTKRNYDATRPESVNIEKGL